MIQPDVLSLADDIVAVVFEESPPMAFLMGIDGGERGGLGDLSETTRDALIEKFGGIATRAQALRDADGTFDDRDLLTVDHIERTASSYVDRLATPHLEFTLTNYPASPLSSLISLLPQLPVTSPERQEGYLRCLREIPRVLTQATERHRDGLARGLTPVARGVTNALSQLDGVLATDDRSGLVRASDDATFVRAQRQLFVDGIDDALREYRAVLATELLPMGRGDDQPGLSWLPNGDDLYRRRVRQYTWSTLSPQEIHDLGQSLIESVHREFGEIGQTLWGTDDFAVVRDHLVNDSVFRFTTSDEIYDTAVTAVRHAESVAPQFFATVPKEPCAVAPIPDALASGAAVAYYYGGAVDGSRPGTYFVNTTKPEERHRHTAEAVAYHEAVPGHHFQLTIAQEQSGSHLVYRITRDVTNSEGWGLYTERLADEMGLYSDSVARLGMLTADAMRAARLVVDTGLHALGWSRDDAIAWMSANVPMALIEITQEIDRYAMIPGQALAYMFGRLEIERCRRHAAEQLGDRFDLRAFHDMVLTTGPIALPAFTAAVERWIAAQA
jgi:uncharacterized protein (DUF885 family)